jgi:hypothetical protein
MIAAFHDHKELSERFMAFLLTRNGRIEADLIDVSFFMNKFRKLGFIDYTGRSRFTTRFFMLCWTTSCMERVRLAPTPVSLDCELFCTDASLRGGGRRDHRHGSGQ